MSSEKSPEIREQLATALEALAQLYQLRDELALEIAKLADRLPHNITEWTPRDRLIWQEGDRGIRDSFGARSQVQRQKIDTVLKKGGVTLADLDITASELESLTLFLKSSADWPHDTSLH